MLIADLWYIIVYQPAVAIVYFCEQKEKKIDQAIIQINKT